jgi:hypothetical protein
VQRGLHEQQAWPVFAASRIELRQIQPLRVALNRHNSHPDLPEKNSKMQWVGFGDVLYQSE